MNFIFSEFFENKLNVGLKRTEYFAPFYKREMIRQAVFHKQQDTEGQDFPFLLVVGGFVSNGEEPHQGLHGSLT